MFRIIPNLIRLSYMVLIFISTYPFSEKFSCVAGALLAWAVGDTQAMASADPGPATLQPPVEEPSPLSQAEPQPGVNGVVAAPVVRDDEQCQGKSCQEPVPGEKQEQEVKPPPKKKRQSRMQELQEVSFYLIRVLNYGDLLRLSGDSSHTEFMSCAPEDYLGTVMDTCTLKICIAPQCRTLCNCECTVLAPSMGFQGQNFQGS